MPRATRCPPTRTPSAPATLQSRHRSSARSGWTGRQEQSGWCPRCRRRPFRTHPDRMETCWFQFGRNREEESAWASEPSTPKGELLGNSPQTHGVQAACWTSGCQHFCCICRLQSSTFARRGLLPSGSPADPSLISAGSGPAAGGPHQPGPYALERSATETSAAGCPPNARPSFADDRHSSAQEAISRQRNLASICA